MIWANGPLELSCGGRSQELRSSVEVELEFSVLENIKNERWVW